MLVSAVQQNQLCECAHRCPTLTPWTRARSSVGGIFQARIASCTSPHPHCTERLGAPSWAPRVYGSFPQLSASQAVVLCVDPSPDSSHAPFPSCLSLPPPSPARRPHVVLDTWVFLTLLEAGVQEQGFAGRVGAGNRVHPPGGGSQPAA